MKPYQTKCTECGASIVRANDRTVHFCDRTCKGNWQRRAKPVTEDWLRTKYLDEKLDCVQIAAIVKRDPKSVWNWLKDFGIQTRKRGTMAIHFKKGHKLGVGKKLTDEHKQLLREARKKDGRIPAYVNGVHWTKAYGRHGSNWKGGITPERQAFYASPEWARVVPLVWQRDDARCRRCGLDHRRIVRGSIAFHIHHIDSFTIKSTRASLSNLVLLCAPCHRWVHGRGNTKGDYIGKGHERKQLDAGKR